MNNKASIDIDSIKIDLANVTRSLQISVNDTSNMIYTENELFKIFVELNID